MAISLLSLGFVPVPVRLGVGASADFTAIANRVNPLIDASGADSVEAVSASRGRLIDRGDGNLSLDLYGDLSTSTVLIVYNRITGGVPTEVAATVSVSESLYPLGYYGGDYYRPATDENDDLILKIGRNHRIFHISTSGLSLADIAAAEGVSESAVDAGFLLTTYAIGGSGTEKYGETPALALQWNAEVRSAIYYGRGVDFDCVWVLYKRGDTFAHGLYDSHFQASAYGIGESKLHPNRIGAYGTGALPVFQGVGIRTDVNNRSVNFVGGEYECAGVTIAVGSEQFLIFDNIKVDGRGGDNTNGVQFEGGSGSNPLALNCTGRRLNIQSISKSIPDAGDTSVWSSDSRCQGMHMGRNDKLHLEKIYISTTGWAMDYLGSGSISGPKSPDPQSHNIYEGQSSVGITHDGLTLLYGSGSAIQLRCGGIIQDIFAAGANHIMDDTGGIFAMDELDAFDHWLGNYSQVHRGVFTAAGMKNLAVGALNNDGSASLGIGEVAGGIKNGSQGMSYTDCIMANVSDRNDGDFDIFASTSDTGPKARGTEAGGIYAFKVSYDFNYGLPLGDVVRDEMTVYNWNWNGTTNPNRNIDGLDTGVLDDLTVENYCFDVLGQTGWRLRDLSDYLDTLDKPWEQLQSLLDYWLVGKGAQSPTPVADATIHFRPDAGGHTPARWADYKIDWAEKHLPGAATGQSVDLEGHSILWNITPENPIVNFTFGVGAVVDVTAGKLAPSGSLVVATGGNQINVSQGSTFLMPAHSEATNLLTISNQEGYHEFAGNCTGLVDLEVHYEAESIIPEGVDVTIPAGRTWTVHGRGYLGFEGAAGGAASLTVNGTLALKSSVRLAVDGWVYDSPIQVGGSGPAAISLTLPFSPKIGSTVTGSVSGATGVVVECIFKTYNTGYVMLENVTGVFVDNDVLTSDDTKTGPIEKGEQAFATVNGTPTYVMPKIGKVRTGANGTAAPNVVPSITLGNGSAVTFSAVGMAPGTYPVMDVDNLLDNGATLQSGLAQVGNQLVLTV